MQKVKSSIWFFSLLLLAGTVAAQQKTVSKSWGFRSINSIGLLEAENGSSFQLQTVNGARYKSWFAGVGVGLDYYRYRSIPLLLDLRKEFGKSANKVFVYTDLGMNFSWVTDKQKQNYYFPDDHFSNGLYSDLGVGYKLTLGKNNGFLISLGYSYKKITETYQGYIDYPYPTYIGNFVAVTQQQKINYSLNRLSIKFGWQF